MQRTLWTAHFISTWPSVPLIPDLKRRGRLSITRGSMSAKRPILSITDMMQTFTCHSPAGGTAPGSFCRQNQSNAQDWETCISGDWKMCTTTADKHIATQSDRTSLRAPQWRYPLEGVLRLGVYFRMTNKMALWLDQTQQVFLESFQWAWTL